MSQSHDYLDCPRAIVNGHPVQIIETSWEAEAWPVNPRVLNLVIARPEPADLLTVGATLQVQVADDVGGDEPISFQVTSARQHEGSPPTYSVELTEVQADQGNDETENAVEILYRSAFLTIVARTQIRALEHLLEAKGIFTADEFRTQLADTARSSFLDFALDIVAEEDAKTMRDGMLKQLEELAHPSATEGQTKA